jgi:hypothetical protein
VSAAAGQPDVRGECGDTPLLPRPSQRPAVEAATDADTPFRGVYRTDKPVLWIREILVRIRIRGSGTFWFGSGSVASSFRQWFSKCKKGGFSKFFSFLFFEGTFKLFFKDKKSKEVIIYKTVDIKVFLTFFA